MSDLQSAISSLLASGTPHWGGAIGSGATVTYSFMTAPPSYASSSDLDGFAAMNDTQMTAVRQALATWSSVTNLTFVEVSDAGAGGDMRFGTNNQHNNSSAYAYFPGPNYGGDVYLSNAVSYTADPAPGTYGFATLLHEIGHGLGLKHPGNYDGSSGSGSGPFLPAAEDNYQYTIMSYTGFAGSGYAPATGPALYDIAAIQYLYGANTSAKAGDDTYRFADTANGFQSCIWDGGGTNAIDASAQSLACRIDLHSGAFSSIGSTGRGTAATNNVAIAFGTQVSNAIGGSGNDTLIANDAGNTLVGNAGNDTLTGGAGRDTAVFSGTASQYRLARSGDAVIVTDTVAGRDGADTLTSIEMLLFADRSLDLTLVGQGPVVQASKTILAFEGTAPQNLGIATPTSFDPSLTVTVNGLPSGGTVKLADGRAVTAGTSVGVSDLAGLTYTAAGTAGGNGAFTYTVTDSTGLSASQTVGVEVRTIAQDLAGFDPLQYLASNADLARAFGTDATAARNHYIANGRQEGRSTNSFDAMSYIAKNPDLAAAFGTDLQAARQHYITSGVNEGRQTSGWDPLAYTASYGDLSNAFGTDRNAAFQHFVTSGRLEGRTTTFSAWDYEAANADIANAFGANTPAAAEHYITTGRFEGRTGTFDGLRYIASNSDLIQAFGANEQAGDQHYALYGRNEGRTATFDAAAYLSGYSDLQTAFGTDLQAAERHYIEHGFHEGRTVPSAAIASLAPSHDALTITSGSDWLIASANGPLAGSAAGLPGAPLGLTGIGANGQQAFAGLFAAA